MRVIVSFALMMEQQSVHGRSAKKSLDERWIPDAAGGDMQALQQLYQATKTDVYAFALSILKNPQNAQDVMQDTYLKIVEAGDKYQAKGKPMAWILTIVRNLALMKLRERGAQHVPLDAQWDLAQDADDAAQALDRMVLHTALEVLASEDRQIVMMHCVTGLKHREIAQVMQMPLSTVLSKYNRSLVKLKKQLEQEERR